MGRKAMTRLLWPVGYEPGKVQFACDVAVYYMVQAERSTVTLLLTTPTCLLTYERINEKAQCYKNQYQYPAQ